MLNEGIIEPIEESKWISPIFIQEKKIGGIKLCVDLRELSNVCIIDPFRHDLPMKYWKV